jgi:urea transporter
MQLVAIWGVCAVMAAILAMFIAPMKNRDYSSWAAWCFLFPPLLIALILSPKYAGPRRRQPTLDQLDHRDDRLI